MDYFLTEEQQMLKELARTIAAERIAPAAAELDEKEIFPRELIKVIADSDLFRVFVPETYGGLGMGVLENCIVMEEFSKACAGVAVTYAASGLGICPLLMFGSEEQKGKYLPDLASGEKLAAFALTEAYAGSDAAGIRTTATADGDEYILNGTKQWITNGGEADVYIVIASTDKSKGMRGASAFIVEKGTPGFSFGKKEKKMGIRTSTTSELVFTDCRIPKENLVGAAGDRLYHCHAHSRPHPSRGRSPGRRYRPRSDGLCPELCPGKDSVRTAGFFLSGCPAYAGRYGDANRSCPSFDLLDSPFY